MIKKLQLLPIILIGIVVVIYFGIAEGATIGDVTSTFQNIVVLGSCTGCGSGSGSFSSYSLLTNGTVTSSSGNQIVTLSTGIDGSILACDTSNNVSIVLVNRTQVKMNTLSGDGCGFSTWLHNGQSSDGKYKFLFDGTTDTLSIYKNNILLQNLTITGTNFSTTNISQGSLSISSDGKYISIYGKDTGGVLDRLVVLQGS